jgi:hypothetical protein
VCAEDGRVVIAGASSACSRQLWLATCSPALQAGETACSPPGRKPKIWTRIDRRDESLRIGVQDLSGDVGITTATA